MPDNYPDNEHQYSGEDNEIEIIDLSTPHKGDATNAASSRRISLGTRYSPGQRRRQLLITSSIIVTLLLIVIGLSPVRDLVISSLFPPTPAPTNPVREAGQDGFFYLQTIPAWGKWYLDGKQLTHVPVFSDEKPLRITAGRHALAWRAQPFQELSCTLIVPPDPTHQTCRTHRQGGNEFTSSSTVVSLPILPSIAQLPSAQRQALLQATRNYLDTFRSSEIVRPGEMYRYNTTSTARVATQPLQARLHFQLDTDSNAPAQCSGPQLGPACTNAANGSDCRLFCTLAWSERDTPDRFNSWDVGVVTRPDWEYIAPGQRIDSEARKPENQGAQQFTTLHISWQQNTWHVTAHPQGDSPFDDPNCIAVVSKIPNMLPMVQKHISGRSSANDEGQQIVRNFTSGSNRAMGCLATALIEKFASAGQPPVASHAYFLWRFNILLAVNDEAHQIWQELPVSGPAGKTIVQEITNHVAFAS